MKKLEIIEKIIKNRGWNYPLYPVISFTLFLITFALYKIAGMDERLDNFLWLGDFSQKFVLIVLFVGSFATVWTISELEIEPMYEAELLFANTSTGILLPEGFYFLYFHKLKKFKLFGVLWREMVKNENKDVIVPVFKCQDKDRLSMDGDANGDYIVVNYPAYRIQDALKMESNLQSAIKKATMRVCGKLEYTTEILGENIGKLVLKDIDFISECKKYGIKFRILIITVIESNLEQASLNSYADKLRKKYRDAYGPNHKFTHEQEQDIEDNVQVMLGRAQKVVNRGGGKTFNMHKV